jgi:hypothetical protein
LINRLLRKIQFCKPWWIRSSGAFFDGFLK